MARSSSAVAESAPASDYGSIDTRIRALETLIAVVRRSGARNDQAFYTVQAAQLRIAELKAWGM